MLNNKNLYEFNKGTLAILPNGKESSLIYEDDSRYIIDDNPLNIMEDSCKYFGSSYEGRKKGAKEILGAEYKVPIVIADTNELIAFLQHHLEPTIVRGFLLEESKISIE